MPDCLLAKSGLSPDYKAFLMPMEYLHTDFGDCDGVGGMVGSDITISLSGGPTKSLRLAALGIPGRLA